MYSLVVSSRPPEQYDEDMEQILIGHIRSDDNQKALESRICHMLSKACLGLRNAKKQDPRVGDVLIKTWE